MPKKPTDKSRRDILKITAGAAVGSLIAPIVLKTPTALARAPAALLDPATLQQFTETLPNPLGAGHPQVSFPGSAGSTDLFIRETTQTVGIRTNGHPVRTRVWGYALGDTGEPTSPGPTFEIERNQKLTVTYINDLERVSNPMPVDTTLDWANPGGLGGHAPVPLVTHLHGARSETRSDGLPEGWSTPGEKYTGRLFKKPYTYENQQESAHMWYHDHARGITRTNVYMGLAGLYFLRDKNERQLQHANVLPSDPHEIALVIQDRQLAADGSLFYPSSDPSSPNSPKVTHLPEFFGDVILVNGKAWPKMSVEQRKYRLRILNASDSRFYGLKLQRQNTGVTPSSPAGDRLKLMVIGNELGFLDSPVHAQWTSPSGIAEPDMLLIAPGERYDVIVDFSTIAAGTRLILWNDALAPYNGQPVADADYAAPTPGTADRVLAFDVVKAAAKSPKAPNATVAIGTVLRRTPGTPPLGAPALDTAVRKRRIMLYEGTDKFGRLQTMIGPIDYDPETRLQGTLNYADPITERPQVGRPEIWEFHNTTADAHPVHMHLVDFRIIDRQPFTAIATDKTNTDNSLGATLGNIALDGDAVPVESFQSGKKDTVVAYPGYITRILVDFSRAGEYVYHCHILSHEDHEMMRPYKVLPSSSGVTIAKAFD